MNRPACIQYDLRRIEAILHTRCDPDDWSEVWWSGPIDRCEWMPSGSSIAMDSGHPACGVIAIRVVYCAPR